MATDTANAERFTKMAARITHNQDATFGGAAVIMPPANGGEPIELLILDSKSDPAQFWGAILSRAQLEVNTIRSANEMRQMTGFETRR